MYKAIPRGADWIRDSVLSVEPEQNLVITASGQQVSEIFHLANDWIHRLMLRENFTRCGGLLCFIFTILIEWHLFVWFGIRIGIDLDRYF